MKREMSEEGNGMEIIDREMAPFFPAIMPVLVYCVSLPSTSLSMPSPFLQFLSYLFLMISFTSSFFRKY